MLVPAAEPAHSTRPPGGERPGRLPGPEGPDRLASGAVAPAAPVAHLLSLPSRRTYTVELPAVPASVRAARGAVGEVLISWGVAEPVHDIVVLVTSELMTNAVTHSGSEQIVCRLHATAGLVRVEVEDQNRGHRLPAPRRPGAEEQSGRGLLLVETLCRDWGTAPAPHGGPGRVVWAELAAEPGPDTGTATTGYHYEGYDEYEGCEGSESHGDDASAAPMADPSRMADPSWTATRPKPGPGHPRVHASRPHGPRSPHTTP
ncbi:ATP-binding protein [Streptomyces sp. YIM S03343]